MEISNAGPRLSLDSLIYDWNRTYRVQCREKVSQVLTEKSIVQKDDLFNSFIAFKYAFMDCGDEIVVYKLKEVPNNKWNGILENFDEVSSSERQST